VTLHDAFIALGSNLGDPPRQIKIAMEAIKNLPETMLMASAAPQWYAPVGGPANQGNFLNTAVHVRTVLAPAALLSQMLAIESRQGRIRSNQQRYGPRCIDLDLLFYDDLIITTPQMRLPHPRISIRHFVLEPLSAIAPDWLHPAAGLSVRELLLRLRNGNPWINPDEETPVCKPFMT
jgi:2-amino-4-hydroxy-6-hydroxymethyldihydropteridine diphosphokinase